MTRWLSTKEPPKKTGKYLAIVKHVCGGKRTYSEPRPIGYSVKYDAWNCDDGEDGDEYRFKDMRDSLEYIDYAVYAWALCDAPTDEELDALMKGGAA